MKIEVIIEKNGKDLWGRIEGKGNYLPVTMADSPENVLKNLRELIADYLEHEGKEDKFWQKVNPEEITFDIHYDLQAFFEEHDYLNVTAIAKRAGMNAALLRQYASGVKYPSPKQAAKIESAIHQLAKDLERVSLYAG